MVEGTGLRFLSVYISKLLLGVYWGRLRHPQSLFIFQLRFEPETRGFKSVVHGLLGVREIWPGVSGVAGAFLHNGKYSSEYF